MPQIKVLIDAVQVASFITKKKVTKLVEKICTLGGAHRNEIFKQSIECFNTRKHSNESICYKIDRLEEAIHKNDKVIFL